MRNFVSFYQFKWKGREVVIHSPTGARFAIFPNGSITLTSSTLTGWNIVDLVGGVERFIALSEWHRP